jgi:N-acetylglucosaminyldiphosphoundecaprenol N-acetyl-beta-D-mannosaminyltransferase
MQKERKTRQIKLLKVRVDNTTLEEAVKKAILWAKDKNQHYITTPNPEIILKASKNKKFLNIINKSDLNIADGTGILWAAKFKELNKNTKSNTKIILNFFYSSALTLIRPKYIKNPIKERVTGVDLMEEICKKSCGENLKIFLLGAKEGIAKKTKEKLEEKYEKITISGTYSGSPKTEDEKKITEKINRSYAEILFVAYGAPQQEIWINKNLKNLKTVKLAIGVGGSFDFIAEIKPRAKKWMQKTGIEWVYRLIQEPKRIKRIYNAVIKFPLMILKKELTKKHL